MSENTSEKVLGPGASGDPNNPGERGNAPAVLSPAEEAQLAGEPPAEVKPPAGAGAEGEQAGQGEQKTPADLANKGNRPPLGQLPDGQK